MKNFTCCACKHIFQAEHVTPCPQCQSDDVALVPDPPKRLKPIEYIQSQLPVWKAKGYKEIIATYAGSGDSGSMEEIVASTVLGGRTYDPEAVALGLNYGTPLTDAFESLAWKEVSDNNEGGGGTIRVNVETGKITRQEYYNVLSTEELPVEEVTEEVFNA